MVAFQLDGAGQFRFRNEDTSDFVLICNIRVIRRQLQCGLAAEAADQERRHFNVPFRQFPYR